MNKELIAKTNDRINMTGAKRPMAVWCQTCKNANGEAPWANGPEKANCKVYQYGDMLKPRDVLFNGADCEFYESED